MKKILITGAGGFIGSHLTQLCVEKGCQVRAFVHYNSTNSHGWLEHSTFKKEIEIITGDIRDFDSVYAAMKGCEEVFHLAALIGIPYSYVSPLAYIKTNVEGTYNILQAARDRELKNIVVTSTSETYGSAQYVPIDEKHPINAQSPYAASKAAADQLALSYHRAFELPVKVARPFNTYGPRQSARAVVPTIITQILSGEEKICLGNLSPTRDFTFVEDTVEGFWAIAKSNKFVGQVVNIGTKQEISIGDLAKLISNLMGRKFKVDGDCQRIRPKDSEVERLLCDNSKILKCTSWKPRYDLKKGLSKTIAWLENNQSLYKAGIYNV